MVLSSLIFGACSNTVQPELRPNYQSVDFSYNDAFSTSFSIRFTQSDTVFIRQHFASFFSDTPQSNTSYYAFIRKTDRIMLDSFMTHVNYVGFDSVYYQSYVDGIDYQLYVEKDGISKTIKVHSDSVPEQLNDLAQWIVETKKTLPLFKIDTMLVFESARDFYPTKIEEPKLKLEELKFE